MRTIVKVTPKTRRNAGYCHKRRQKVKGGKQQGKTGVKRTKNKIINFNTEKVKKICVQAMKMAEDKNAFVYVNFIL